jgi:hypothetical protein
LNGLPLPFFLWSRLQADVYDDGMRAFFIILFFFFFLPTFLASLASRAIHTHPIMAATPGVYCINTSEFGISSPGFYIGIVGEDGVWCHFWWCRWCLFAFEGFYATSTAMLMICFYIFFLFERLSVRKALYY